MSEIRNLGKINTKILEKEFGKIETDEIIVTNERIDHIKERHPEDYNLFEKYGKESVSSPDLIIKDVKNKSTVFMIKKLLYTYVTGTWKSKNRHKYLLQYPIIFVCKYRKKLLISSKYQVV